MSDYPTAIAWGLEYDGSGGLKMEVIRRFILIEEYVALGATNLTTGAFEWTVSRNGDADDAREHAINLTRLSEEWGCTLVDHPRARAIRQSRESTERWLSTITDNKELRTRGVLDATYLRTMRGGTRLE